MKMVEVDIPDEVCDRWPFTCGREEILQCLLSDAVDAYLKLFDDVENEDQNEKS